VPFTWAEGASFAESTAQTAAGAMPVLHLVIHYGGLGQGGGVAEVRQVVFGDLAQQPAATAR
jgi:hypothetical protein